MTAASSAVMAIRLPIKEAYELLDTDKCTGGLFGGRDRVLNTVMY